MVDLTNKARIYVDPRALAEKRAGIAYARPGEQTRGAELVRSVGVRCRCGHLAAEVAQHDDAAHVVLADDSSLEVRT